MTIMRVTDETDTMPRSFLMKKYNYSHCPLKKRPIQFFKEENFENDKDLSDDNSEPENLCTRPQDLSRKNLTPTPAIALITSIKKSSSDDQILFKREPRSPIPFSSSELPYSKSGGPLEPLNLNTSANYHPQPPTWPRAVPAHYPPNYVPLNYFYPPPVVPQQPITDDSYHHYYPSRDLPDPRDPRGLPRDPREPIREQLSPYAPYEPSVSPPHAFTPFRSHAQIVAAVPHCPNLERSYTTYSHSSDSASPLSPTSSSSSSFYLNNASPPPISPEDLSSAASVVSGGGDAGSTKRKVKDSTNAPRYKCAFCSKSYSTYSGLSKHQQFHCSANEDSTAKKTFSCKYCEKVYVSLGALKMHIRTHTLPCKCKLCGKAFSRPWLLQGHIRTHTGEKPFTCPHCNRAFADRSNLRAHLQTHSDVKKYSCTTCSKTFSRMSLLSKHNDGGCPGNGNAVIRIADESQRSQTFY